MVEMFLVRNAFVSAMRLAMFKSIMFMAAIDVWIVWTNFCRNLDRACDMCWKAVLSPFAKSGPAAFDSRVYSDCTRTGDVDRLLSKVSEPMPKSIDTGRGSVTVAIVRPSC